MEASDKRIVAVGLGENLVEQVKNCSEVEVAFVEEVNALRMRDQASPDVILIALQSQTINPVLSTLPALKEVWPGLKVIALTDSVSPSILDHAFKAGVDDFIKVPIDPMELFLRASVKKKDQDERQAIKSIQFGDVIIDCDQKTVRGPKGKKIISPIEIKVLANLAKANGSLMEKHGLKAKCWGQFGVTDNALHRKLHEIRAILKEVSDQVTIKSKYGSGFYLIFKTRYKMAS